MLESKQMHFNHSESTTYQSYLLRLWRDSPHQPWRASLHSSATGAIHQFAEIAHLYAFLQARTGEGGEPAINEFGDADAS
jgi:hypothetical protein